MNVTSWAHMKERLTIEAEKFLKEAYGLDLNIPIEINNRLKSTFGRFRYNGTHRIPLKIEIGKNYIEHQEWKIIKETLIHECIHYALFVLGKPHKDGHPVFEAEIQKHGSHSTGVIRYKGKVVQYGCPSCNAVFNRKKRYPRNGAGYQCSQCKEQIVFLGEACV